ncbi:hypothetical protein ZWY2020_021992 [Hordeum vulgare]|nr:hypothetical protein ZWY2020_021992 [Hordeum vulgare]
MANAVVLLLITVLAATSGIASATAGGGGSQRLSARRSRFLLVVHPPLPAHECSKKSAEACVVTGPMCCSGQCMDTAADAQHCGGCNKACKHDQTCCGGRCVDLLSDKRNCGTCSKQCNNKCSYGLCDYAH